jgi:hypothetical protein
MAVRLIGHEESFEVRYSHGRPSKYFYFDEHPRDLGGLLFRTRPPPKPDSPPLRLLFAFARNQSASSISNTIAFSLSRANGRGNGVVGAGCASNSLGLLYWYSPAIETRCIRL